MIIHVKFLAFLGGGANSCSSSICRLEFVGRDTNTGYNRVVCLINGDYESRTAQNIVHVNRFCPWARFPHYCDVRRRRSLTEAASGPRGGVVVRPTVSLETSAYI